jgi:hypothetical protein
MSHAELDLTRFLRAHAEAELAAAIRAEGREAFGTRRLRTRYKRCHEIAVRAMKAAPEGTVMVQGIDRSGFGPRRHSWLELPDGRTWDPVTCQYDEIQVISVAARYGVPEVWRKVSETGFYGWWS